MKFKLVLVALSALLLSIHAEAQSAVLSASSYPCNQGAGCNVPAYVQSWFDSQVGYTWPASREHPSPVFIPPGSPAVQVSIQPGSGPLTLTNGVWFTGQAKIAVTGTAVQLSTNPNYTGLVGGIIVKACNGPSPEHVNVANIYIAAGQGVQNTGGGTGNGDSISPGERLGININNPSVIWINGTANDCVTWSGN